MSMSRPNAPICVVLLRYRVPVSEVDAHMPAHVAWLEKGYAEGLFLMSGRRVPRTGGVILVRGHRQEVEALMASDPFVSSGSAEAEVIEFTASMAVEAVAVALA